MYSILFNEYYSDQIEKLIERKKDETKNCVPCQSMNVVDENEKLIEGKKMKRKKLYSILFNEYYLPN